MHFSSSYAFYMPHPPHPTLFDLPNES